MSLNRARNAAIDDSHVVAIHPGPPADFQFPVPASLSPAERLAGAERELLDLAVDRFVHRSGRMGELAVKIVVMRAEQAGAALAS